MICYFSHKVLGVSGGATHPTSTGCWVDSFLTRSTTGSANKRCPGVSSARLMDPVEERSGVGKAMGSVGTWVEHGMS